MRRESKKALIDLIEAGVSAYVSEVFPEDKVPERKQGDTYTTTGIIAYEIRDTSFSGSNRFLAAPPGWSPYEMVPFDISVQHRSSATREAMKEAVLDVFAPKDANGRRTIPPKIVSDTTWLLGTSFLNELDVPGFSMPGETFRQEPMIILTFKTMTTTLLP